MYETILAFFRKYDLACIHNNTADAVAAFSESFFYSDGATTRMLHRAAISAAAAQRRDLMATAGFGPSTLTQLDVFPLDAQHAWVSTVWTAAPSSDTPGRQPLILRATYLVAVGETSTQIVAYLSHTNFAEALAKAAQTVDQLR